MLSGQPRRSFFAELKRRHVLRVALAYTVVGASVGGAADAFLPNLGAPPWVLQTVLTLIILGLPISLVLAWAYDITPDGITRTEALQPDEQEDAPPTAIVKAAADVEARVPSSRSIAVVPFDNDDPEQRHLANGLAEELLNVLAQFEGLTVKSWTSSRALFEQGLPAPEVGRRLSVAHVLEGSIRRSGERLRITPRLVDTRSERQVWSEIFDETISDVFEIEDRITSAVAGELELHLTGRSTVAARSTSSDQAHELYLRGREAYQAGDESGLRSAVEYYRQALALDSEYALAWSGMAEAYIFLADAYMPPIEAYAMAREAALRALALEELPEARAAFGFTGIANDWDWAGVKTCSDQAIALNPNLAMAYVYRTWPLLLENRHDEALRGLDHAIELDPEFPFGDWIRSNTLMFLRRFEEAIESSRELDEADPPFYYVESWGAAGRRALGRYDQALAQYDRIRRAYGDQPMPGLAVTHARMGSNEEARAILRQLEEESERRYTSPVMIALIHAELGDREAMIAWLERALELRDIWIFFSIGLEEFDPYRKDEAFRGVMERAGLSGFPWVRDTLGVG